jgi:hypothetical protein
MRLSYDPAIDSQYIRLNDHPGADSTEVSLGVVSILFG